jgi:galactonate dehydratase
LLQGKLTPLQAPPVIEAVAQFNPLFVEDPVQIDSIVSQAEIARRVTQPIANGERMHSIWEFREMLAHGGSQYVRPDVGLALRITGPRFEAVFIAGDESEEEHNLSKARRLLGWTPRSHRYLQ